LASHCDAQTLIRSDQMVGVPCVFTEVDLHPEHTTAELVVGGSIVVTGTDPHETCATTTPSSPELSPTCDGVRECLLTVARSGRVACGLRVGRTTEPQRPQREQDRCEADDDVHERER